MDPLNQILQLSTKSFGEYIFSTIAKNCETVGSGYIARCCVSLKDSLHCDAIDGTIAELYAITTK